MRANELMIGDWVMVAECVADAHFINYPDKIESIRDGLVGLESDGFETIIERIAPISLTAEILAKNFKADERDEYTNLYVLNDDYYDLHIVEYSDEMWQVTKYDCEFADMPIECFVVCKVHQLQQVLRLFHINKEIEL